MSRGSQPDRSAFRALVLAHEPAVHALLARIVFRGAVADVDDLAQETFIRVHRALAQFEDRGPRSLEKWILTIATRVAIDHLRKHHRPHEPFDEGVHRLPMPTTDELSRLRRLSDRVERVLAELSAEQRAVLVLRDFHELEYREIADALGLDLGTVKSRLHRARTSVREALRKERSG
jgi:RNA polymerase sigma-70 factor (ECF subfamily)